ncbi:MAG TPA: ComEC/Rec2 family competence protein [Pyrinomonadaceae bacterium]|jgi:competence protein ComEC
MQDSADVRPLTEKSNGEAFTAHPLAQLAVAFALGILSAVWIATPLILLSLIAALATTLALMALLWWKRMRLATVFVTVAMLLPGSLLAAIERKAIPANQLRRLITEGTIVVGQPVELTGVLERDPEVGSERLYLFLRVQKVTLNQADRNVSGEVLLFAPVSTTSIQQEYDQLDLRYGARIRVMTMLERADSFRNPGVSSFTEYLDRKGYDATGFVKSPLLIERLENERVFLPLAWLYEWRRKLQAEIDSRFTKDAAGVLDAALLGNRYKLSRSSSERFREGGTFHVLVISGLHITFLGGLVFLIARRFTKNRTLQFLVSVTVLWSYSLAVGAESSVVRAALMFTFVLLGPLVSRRASSLNALGGAALVLLTFRPNDLLDPSFQLTFLSVLAIVMFAWPLLEKMSAVGSWRPTRGTPYPPVCAPWLREFCESLYWSEQEAQRELRRMNYSYKLLKVPLADRLERLHIQRLVRYAFAAILVSACVQMVMFPLLVVYFHRLSLASFLLNIGVSLMMAAFAVTAGIAIVVAQVSNTLAAPLINTANTLNWMMVHSVDPFTRVHVASIRLPEYTGWSGVIYVLYYLPLTMLAVSLSGWKPLDLPRVVTESKRCFKSSAVFGQLLAITLIVFHPWSAGGPQGRLRIDFLDVGQGDSALVTFPDNTTLLIDGGGRPGPFNRESLSGESEPEGEETLEPESRSIGEAVVSEYLWWRGLDHIDYLLATHADADHIDGLNDVARNFEVRGALVARTPAQDREYERFSETLFAEQIPLRLVGAGDVLRFGEVTATVLWPPASVNPNAASRNNDSIVLRLQMDNRALLLTGDIEMAGEKAILDSQQNVHADVVKVAHHGSKTSSIESFIAAAQPSFAIISVGQTSIFGHPNKGVVERWKASGAQLLTTGTSGTITVTTDGRNLEVKTFLANKN